MIIIMKIIIKICVRNMKKVSPLISLAINYQTNTKIKNNTEKKTGKRKR